MSDCYTWRRSTDAPADWENSWCQRMNPGAVTKCEELLDAEDSRGRSEVRSRLTCVDITNGQSSVADGQSSVADGQSAAGSLPRKDTAADHSSTTKYRRYGSRLGGVKVRHKRQALQDMARPLKHWLYKHRDNPYPTKTEKVLLALGSHMTLVQVSNWFANARRRLKNTVRQPDLSWALRIKLYNKYIQGNAERLSVSSDGSNSDDEGCPLLQVPVSHQSEFNRSGPGTAHQKQGGGLSRADSAHSDDSASTPSKYKSSLLNRYLNDTLRHVMAATSSSSTSPSSSGDMVRTAARKRRSHSESFSSNECDDDDAVSPASSPSSETEANFVYRMDTVDYTSVEHDTCRPLDRGLQCRQEQEWREIHAAMALTNLAQGQSCTRGPNAAGQTTCTRGPTAIARATVVGKICATGPTVGPFITAPAITSRIIQKSSHISEIKTVKVALVNSL